MAKIRIRSSDEAEYKRLVRNAKAKMRRLKKDHGIDLSDEISLPSLSSFQTRKEFNNFKEVINKFNKGLKNDYKIVKNEQGVAFTKKEVKNYERKQKEAIELAEQYYQKTKTENQKIFLKPSNLDIPRKIDLNDIKTRENFKNRMENLTKRSNPDYFNERDELFKTNYIKSILGSFNEREVVNEIVELLQAIPADRFYDIYKEYLEFFDFELFDSEGQSVGADDGHLAAIRLVLSSSVNEARLLQDFPDKV
jgi:predicted transcriptional regulator